MHRDEGIGMSREAALQLECSCKNTHISQLKEALKSEVLLFLEDMQRLSSMILTGDVVMSRWYMLGALETQKERSVCADTTTQRLLSVNMRHH